MEILPDPLAATARAGTADTVAPARPPSARFDLAVFEEGQRGGNPWLTALDPPGTRPGPSNDLPLDLDRRHPDRPDDTPASDLGLADLLDVINPLHHIPLVGNVYRVLTGDTISGPAQVAGATLYGGPIGLVSGLVKAVASEINGADPGDTLVARLIDADAPDEIAVAQAAPAADADLAPAAKAGDGTPSVTAAPAAQDATAEPTGPPALTGHAALAALFADLRPQNQTDAPNAVKPSPVAETRDAGIEPRNDDRAPAVAVPEHAFSARMMEGLDKYRALAVERGGAGRPAPARLDRSL